MYVCIHIFTCMCVCIHLIHSSRMSTAFFSRFCPCLPISFISVTAFAKQGHLVSSSPQIASSQNCDIIGPMSCCWLWKISREMRQSFWQYIFIQLFMYCGTRKENPENYTVICASYRWPNVTRTRRIYIHTYYVHIKILFAWM